MSRTFNPDLDLTVTRLIAAPRAVVWQALTTPRILEQWWVPEPGRCRVLEMDLRPGGAFVSEYSENGSDFGPHIRACILAADPLERFVFTDGLLGGWRPSEQPFMTGIFTLRDHPRGTEYTGVALHKNNADRNSHETMGFYDGWGTVADQLARLVEKGTS